MKGRICPRDWGGSFREMREKSKEMWSWGGKNFREKGVVISWCPWERKCELRILKHYLDQGAWINWISASNFSWVAQKQSGSRLKHKREITKERTFVGNDMKKKLNFWKDDIFKIDSDILVFASCKCQWIWIWAPSWETTDLVQSSQYVVFWAPP